MRKNIQKQSAKPNHKSQIGQYPNKSGKEQVQDESALGKLMSDFRCTEAKNMNYKVLADRVKYFKEDEKEVQTMCRALEEMREEVREEERIKAIRCMIQFEIPKEKILSKGYSEEEYKVAKEKI